MLASKLVESFRSMGPNETAPNDEVTITTWMRKLVLEESR